MVTTDRRPSKTFIDWVTALMTDVDAAPATFTPVQLTEQAASIGVTAIPTGALSAGLYRVSWHARITTADGVSSSLTVSFAWTERTTSQSYSGSAITGNTTGTHQSDKALLIRIDAATPISYSTTYVSNTPGQMKYSLDMTLEAVAA